MHTLSEHVRQRPQQTALTFLRDGENDTVTLTYSELDQRARAIAGHILAVAPNAKRALLLHPPGLEFAAALCGCFYAGVTAVPCYPPSSKFNSRSGERFLRLVNDAQVELALTDSANVSRIFLHLKQLSNLRLLATDKTEEWEGVVFPDIRPDDLALIQYTSGSTGSPKGVKLSQANLMANLSAIEQSFGRGESACVVNWLPPYHDMGLIGSILGSLVCGYALVMLEPRHFLQKPLRWLQAISRYRADTSGGPGFAYDLCASNIAAEEIEKLDLSCWELAFCGAETVRAATLRRFSSTFARSGFSKSALFPCYGLAEATLMATAARRTEGARIVTLDTTALSMGYAVPSQQQNASELVSCGKPGASMALRIVDPKTLQVCEVGTIGEIWLSGASVSQGYWNQHEASRNTFENKLEHEGEACWLRTGDLGFVLDGELFVSGRLKDLIIIRGRNYHPPDIEEVICSSHPALAFNACAAFSVETETGEQLVIAAEVRREARHRLDGARVVRAMRAALSESLELRAQVELLLMPGTLPRTTSGKISRTACRQQYLSGHWAPIPVDESQFASPPAYARPSSATEEKLFRHIATVLRVPADSLDQELSLGILGMDSLKRVELAITLEQSFGIHLNVELFEPDLTLAEMAKMLQKAPLRDNEEAKNQLNSEADAFDKPGREVPLTPLQHAFLHAGVEKPESFLEIVYLRTPRNLKIAALQLALSNLEASYDSLRLRFHNDGSGWKQVYGNRGTSLLFELLDATGLSATAVREQRAAMVGKLKSGINLAEGPLVKAVLYNRGTQESGILGLSFHHLVIDVLSASIFITTLQHAYSKALSGLNKTSCEEPLFGRWLLAMDAHAQGNVLNENDHWRGVCGELTTDVPVTCIDNPKINSFSNWKLITQRVLSPVENSQFLLRYPAPMQRHDVFLAAFSQAWCKVSGDDHALILLERHGRKPYADTAPLKAMGWFVCCYPVRIPHQAEITPEAMVNVTQQIMREVPGGGESYGLLSKVCRDETIRAGMRKLRRPRLKLIYRGSIDDGFRADALFPVIGSESCSHALYEAQERAGENCHIELYVSMTRGTLSWTLQYATAYCDEIRAHALADEICTFIQVLANVI